MSWLTSSVKKIRKAAGLPAITIGNTVKAVATGGSSVALSTGATWTERAKSLLTSKTDSAAKTITQARQASAAVDVVQDNKVPLMIAAVVAVWWFFGREG